MKNYRYQIVLNSSLNDDDKNVIVHLYQPILGLTSTQIYFSLIEEEKLMKNMPKSVFTEQEFASFLGLEIPSLKNELIKLEGMDLLKSFINHKTKTLTYQIQKPLDPRLFFKNVLFNDVLKHKLGAERYEMVKVFYLSNNPITTNNDVVETTASFEQAFNLEFESFKFHDLGDAQRPVDQELVDFSGVEKLMKINKMDVAALTNDVKTALLANIDTTIFCDEELIEMLKKAYDFDNYVINLDHLNILLKEAIVKKQDNSVDELTATKLKDFEAHDAIEYASILEEQPADRTIVNIINNLRKRIFGFKKPNDGVINCLLEYSYWKNNTKIVGNYLYKIADSVVEKGLDTTKKVMDYLRQVASYAKSKVQHVTRKVEHKFNWVKEPISDFKPEEEIKQREASKDESIAWLRNEINN